MILGRTTGPTEDGKGWFVGPWMSAVPAAIGWADQGVNLSHRHNQMNEIYLVARGSSVAVVTGQTVRLTAGDMLLVEPGESHTFVESSPLRARSVGLPPPCARLAASPQLGRTTR
jgi:mannose-6-phosphate isomerase-like protein (cupin superfamily)